MTVASEDGIWQSFVVFTDRASFSYSKIKTNFKKTVTTNAGFTYVSMDNEK
jgi:hypothetical protein